ncbi:hypothetical protein CI109_100505 [Kwoniella shandongensis]|uniref:Uncharacterized protein n=1 Tax=Kwoniella shandongensis TaxID=1734106 RepID=A0A5M6C7E7_9TREE|nr:uncharacterized protein CI109_001651 [Kwoniella shandongensis]KAA5529712.1 hypothetical protein CI109_001651 [Kwoniella shandongensis]
MSLLAPRMPEPERASVILPTVTCSSCAAPIPLSSLGEHVCLPPSRGMANRSAPRPSQITIPQARPSMSRQGSSQGSQGPSPMSVRPPFAGPSSAHPSPTEFAAPRRPSPNNLSPHDPSGNGFTGYAPNVRTPSPTNPFFPHPDGTPQPAGLGLGAGVMSSAPESAPMIDTTSGGESGMAGVGRRAFAAAAWGVRAGVALAAQARSPIEQLPQALPPWQQTPRSDPTPREPPIFPKVPLSGRQRSNPGAPPRPTMNHSHTAPLIQHSPPRSRTPSSPPQRSASAMSQRSAPIPVSPPRRKESVSSETGSHASNAGESIAQLLKGRAAPPAKPGFFDKMKELNVRSNTASPVFGIGMTRSTSTEPSNDPVVESPAGTTFELDDEFDDLDRGSALPWATPQLNDSPAFKQGTSGLGVDTSARSHKRYLTAGSEASSSSSVSSSSRSGPWGTTSGPDNEEVVTPSQSWEGLADRARGDPEANNESFTRVEGRDILHQIGEEDEDDEGERVVFGTPTVQTVKGGENRMPNSHSASTITSARPYLPTTVPNSSPARPRVMPNSQLHLSPSKSSASGSSTSERRRKTCQKCGDIVGGSKRFVERDGVVLCEKDWKKLYLPSCRRCILPIEKSAVSSSDGQLKGKWHRACFTCTRCDEPFEGDSFYVHGGKPWCQHHYHEENGTLCASSSCQQPIEGPCILTPGPNPQRFHPNHLRCDHRGGVSGAQTCRESMEEYYDVGGERFCERHVSDALRRFDGPAGAGGGGNGLGKGMLRAEKRRTRLVDLPVGGFEH